MYQYEDLKPQLFTEENQKDFLKVRDHVKKVLATSGAITMGEAIRPITGDTWLQMAYVDRLVELGEICEVKQVGDVAGQHRIFRKL